MAKLDFVSRFPFNGAINWFPGHMAKATRRIGETLKKIDTVIELRDGRLPITSANPQLHAAIKGKRRVVVITKMDLCNRNVTLSHTKHILKSPHVAGVVIADARHLTPNVRSQLTSACKSSNDTVKQVWLICGMPNVGKSTFINSLIGSGKKAPTSSLPGWTRGQTFYILKRENALLLDTPGVMVPGVMEPQSALNLAVCGCIQDNAVPGGIQLIAEYLLFLLNEREDGIRSYMQLYKIDRKEPILFFQELAAFIKKSKGKFDEEAAARHFLGEFRNGNLGHYTLDALPLENDEFTEKH